MSSQCRNSRIPENPCGDPACSDCGSELRAPRGKYRVIGVDTFDGTDWVVGDFDTLEVAVQRAREKGGEMLKTHVYNDHGEHLFEAGRF